jgi:hypothetical protein
MALKRRSSSEPDNDVILGLVRDIYDHAEATKKVQLELQYFREKVQPIVNLYDGVDGRESLATRVKVLEDAQKRLEDRVRKADNTEIDKDLIGIKRDIEELITDVKDLNIFKEASKASWKTYVLAIIKWVGAITSAYVIFKLTGK